MTRTVLMVESPARGAVSARWTARSRKRRLVWRNRPRNIIIATLARALAEANEMLLQRAHVRLPSAYRIDWRRQHNVTILVDGTQHGRELLKLLPGWLLLHAVPGADSQGSIEVEDATGWIITLVHAMRHGVDGDVLIRATGGDGRLLLRGIPPDDAPILIIDFADSDDDSAQNDTRARANEYCARGWRIFGYTLGANPSRCP